MGAGLPRYASAPIPTMEYQTAFRVFLGPAARSGMIASTARYGRDHAQPTGATEKDTTSLCVKYRELVKYRDIFRYEDEPSEAD